MFHGGEGHFALADLDRVLPHLKSQPTFEHVDRQRPSLVVFVERRAGTECQKDQSKRSGLDEGACIPVTVLVRRFLTQPRGFFCEIEPQQSADQRARLALIASTCRRESVWSLAHACPISDGRGRRAGEYSAPSGHLEFISCAS